MSDCRVFTVPDGLADQRIDSGLSRMLGLSRSEVSRLISGGLVLVDGVPAVKSGRLSPGSTIEVEIPEKDETPIPLTPLGLDILYEDDDLVAVDKPVGVAAHPGPGWSGPTVVGALAAAGYRISTSGPLERQGIVQRLDVGTSGVMVIAKSELAYTGLKKAFKHRRVAKIYHALVQGHMDPLSGTIDAPLGRHPSRDFKMAILSNGKPALTHFTTLEAMPGTSLLEIELETGRTHQIRVHFAALNHPCVGDLQYGADPRQAERLHLNRQWLHAVSLTLQHPLTDSLLKFEAPYPADLQKALEIVRG